MSDTNTKIAAFFSQFKYQQFRKGEILIRADDDPFGVYYLSKGSVKEYTISLSGEENTITIFKSGSFFPMSWAFNRGINKFNFEAVTEVEAYLAPPDMVLDFVKSNPDVLLDLVQRVYKGIEGLTEKLVFLMSESAHHRLVLELLIIAKRFGSTQKINRIAYHLVTINEKDLAAQTGLARETISRELQALKKSGAVKLDKSQMYINVELLESMLPQIA